MAEIHANNSEFKEAIENYQALLQERDADGKVLMKEKVLMRLAECCYRLEKVPEGLAFLDRLQADINPRRIYTIFLLRGKCLDLQREFERAAEQFELSL